MYRAVTPVLIDKWRPPTADAVWLGGRVYLKRQVQKSDRINSDRQSGSDQLDSDQLGSNKKIKIKLIYATTSSWEKNKMAGES